MAEQLDQQTDFDADLRRLLAPDAGMAPMPTRFLEVPDAWVGRRAPRRWTWSRSAAAVAAATIAVVVVVVAIGRPGNFAPTGGAPVSRGEAAAVLDVPITQVLTTVDGALAIRRDGPTGEIVVVRRDGGALRSQQLIAFTAPSGPDVHWSAGPISCDGFLGLQQPNIMFGQTPSDAEELVLDGASGSGTWNDDFFLFALDDADVPDDTAVVVRGTRGSMSVGSEGALGWTFNRMTPCGHWDDAAAGVTQQEPLADTMCIGFGESIIGPAAAMPAECRAIITEAGAAGVERPDRALLFTQVSRSTCAEATCSDAVPSTLWQVLFTYDDRSAVRVESVRQVGGRENLIVSEVTLQPDEAFCTPLGSGSDGALHPSLPMNSCDMPPITIPTPATPAP